MAEAASGELPEVVQEAVLEVAEEEEVQVAAGAVEREVVEVLLEEVVEELGEAPQQNAVAASQ